MKGQKCIWDIKNRIRIINKALLGNRSESRVWLYNFFDVRPENMWLTRFMRKRGLLDKAKRFSFYSVFGDKRSVRYDKRDVIVFITAENVHTPRFIDYADNMLSEKKIALALGFDYIDNPRYVRMPLWLRTQFDPEWSEKEILDHVRRLRYPDIGERDRFAALIARYDWGNTRSQIYESLAHIGQIQCPSKVLHNDDTLVSAYHDDKQAYLRQFYFNICPENSNCKGYVTEKVFDSIASGCIPIYWGSDNQPEPEVLNQEAMILWNIGGDNTQNISQIQHLWNNKGEWDDFMHQPRLIEGAEEEILLGFNQLEEAIRRVLN